MPITINGSSGIVGANGSVTFPALTGADIDTGVFFPEANVVAFSVGGTESFRANANGIFVAANTNIVPSSSYLRNRIINGDMRINQRAQTSYSTNGEYTVDRWSVGHATSGGYTVVNGTASPPGFNKCISFQKTVGATPAVGDANYIAQIIEGFNIADLAWGTANAKTATLSFWVNAAATGTFSGSIRNGGTGGFYSYPFTYTISAVSTWTYITVTIPGPTVGTWSTDSNAGVTVFFDLGSGSTYRATAGSWVSGNFAGATGATTYPVNTTISNFYLTGVQFEVGSVATPFERRHITQELHLCQRYYTIWQGAATASGFTGIGVGTVNDASSALYIIALPAQMRTSPPTWSFTAGNIIVGSSGGGGGAVNAISQSYNAGGGSAMILGRNNTSGGPFAVGASIMYCSNTAAARLEASSEY